jgi:hypothetical protein
MRSKPDTTWISSDAWWVDPATFEPGRAGGKRKSRLLRTGALTMAAAITAFMVFVLVLHNRNTWWSYNLQSEGTAKQTVERYLAGVQADHRFPADRAINKSGEGFVALGQYQYVGTVSKKRTERQYNSVTPPVEMGLFKKLMTFETYETFISNLEHLYEWQLIQGAQPLLTVTRLHDYNYVFIYHVVLINQFGEQFARQFLFEVHPTFMSDPAFTITDLSEAVAHPRTKTL